MKTRVALVHATLAAVAPALASFRTLAPELELLNFVDEGLLADLSPDGPLPDARVARLSALISAGVESGACAALLTCSAYSPALPRLRKQFRIPVVGIDDAMIAEAVGRASRAIGIVATVGTAAPTTQNLLEQAAGFAGKRLVYEQRCIPEAFSALKAGDTTLHNQLVRSAALDLCATCDVVVLAQVSMSTAVLAPDAPAWPRPVLTSAHSSVQALRASLLA